MPSLSPFNQNLLTSRINRIEALADALRDGLPILPNELNEIANDLTGFYYSQTGELPNKEAA